MTVAELIAILQDWDPDAHVVVYADNGIYNYEGWISVDEQWVEPHTPPEGAGEPEDWGFTHSYEYKGQSVCVIG